MKPRISMVRFVGIQLIQHFGKKLLFFFGKGGKQSTFGCVATTQGFFGTSADHEQFPCRAALGHILFPFIMLLL